MLTDDRRKVAAEVLDGILNAHDVSYTKVDGKLIRRKAGRLAIRGVKNGLHAAPGFAYRILNTLTFVFIIAGALIYVPQYAGGEPIYLTPAKTSWTVHESPVYIYGDNAGANRGLTTIFKNHNYSFVNAKEESRFYVEVQVFLKKPAKCDESHRGYIELHVRDRYTNKSSTVRSASFEQKFSCVKKEFASELEKALNYEVIKARDELFVSFIPNAEGEV